MAATKNDFIVGAYEQMRISGITVSPSAYDNELALKQLENLFSEFAGRNICLGYNFEDTPLTTSVHNVDRKYWYPVEMLLADRLLAVFGKNATPEFIRNRSGAQAFLSASGARVRQVQYPSRMPVGNRITDFRFYDEPAAAPIECATNTMYIGDIDDFVEHFDSYLNAGETIASYVLTADTGLTVVSESLSSPDVNYQISAVGNGESEDLQVKIVATTSDGRIKTRIINFSLVEA